jgi:hypothetical protein
MGLILFMVEGESIFRRLVQTNIGLSDCHLESVYHQPVGGEALAANMRF